MPRSLAPIALMLALCAVPAETRQVTFGPVRQVNAVTAGDQRNPALAAGPFISLPDRAQRSCGDVGVSGGIFAYSTTNPGEPSLARYRESIAYLTEMVPDFSLSAAVQQDDGRVALGGSCFGDQLRLHGAVELDTSGELDVGLTFPEGGLDLPLVRAGGQRNPELLAVGGDLGILLVIDTTLGVMMQRFLVHVLVPELSYSGTPEAVAEEDDVVISIGVCGTADGGGMAVWEAFGSGGNDASGSSIQARRIGFDGDPVGSQFQVNSCTTGNQSAPRCAGLPGGGTAVVWSSGCSFGDDLDTSVQLRLLSPSGAFLGPEAQVNQSMVNFQWQPDVSADSLGRIGVAWRDQPLVGNSIKIRRFDAGGVPLGDEQQVNEFTDTNAAQPKIVSLDGAWMMAWESNADEYGDSDGSGIVARIAFEPLFADGFESGDTQAWSSAPN